jgi:hypothetical protein
MKPILFVITTLLSLTISAQTPQFAVVRPDGTTYVFSSFDGAYTQATDDDIIYLPGTIISGDKTISKRLTLIGTGHYPDSTIYTGKTKFTGNIFLEKKCTLEGFEVSNSIAIINSNPGNCSFIRMFTPYLTLGGTNDNFIDGSVIQLITGQIYLSGICSQSSNLFIRNSILRDLNKIQYSNFNNCLFLGFNSGGINFQIANSIFSSCIFRGLFGADWGFQTNCFPLAGNSSNNCIWYNSESFPGQNNYITTRPDEIMVNSGLTGSIFDYSNNYHLIPGSPYLTAGNDGTQIGIYGGVSPYKEGAVPSNPHIYFKQIAPQTNSNGQLQIQVKVRTNN